jgi:transcriptional regulator with PAS, ATPase and Fis domain
VVAASNAELVELVDEGKFREDLYYRLAAFPLMCPTLAERLEDVEPLAEHFLKMVTTAVGSPCPRLSAESIRILKNHFWAGNVRELQHVMERASILAEDSDTVRPEHLCFLGVGSNRPGQVMPIVKRSKTFLGSS